MAYKDPEKQKEYDRERKRKEREKVGQDVVTPVLPDVLPHAQSRTVLPAKDVLPVQLTPIDPYDHKKALEHMMRMHPVYSDEVRTTPHGVTYHPIIGWREGEVWQPTPVVTRVDKARLARLKKVIKDLELVKVA